MIESEQGKNTDVLVADHSQLNVADESCKTCRFYIDHGLEGGRGWCRRYPKTVSKASGSWCGEYSLRHTPATLVPM
jgi:hypothetical protein